MEEVIDDFVNKLWTNDRVVELQSLADEEGWECTPRQRFAEQPLAIKSFKLFKGKKGKRLLGITRVATSVAESDVRLYDYVYYSDGGKKKTTVIEIFSPQLELAPFHLKPRNGIATFIRKTLGAFRSLEDGFEQNHLLLASEVDHVYQQIPDSVFEQVGDSQGLSLEGDGNYLLYYFKGKQLSAPSILDALEKALQFTEAIVFDREKDFV